MAVEAKSETEPQDGTKTDGAAPKKSKKTLFKVGAGVCVIALAGLMAVVTVQKKKQPEHAPELEGPFVAKLSSSEIQVNLAGEGSKRYLVMALNVEFLTYDEHYVAGRLVLPAAPGGGHGGAAPTEDPIYTARIKDALLKIAASKTRDEVTNPALADAFMEEIRRAIDPILFDLHVGDSTSPSTPDSQSGVRVGESGLKSTLRGLLHEHALHFDGPGSTLALDDGTAVPFKTTDRDLLLTNKTGDTVHVDLSLANAKYKGDVPIGRPGRVTQVYRESFLVQ